MVQSDRWPAGARLIRREVLGLQPAEVGEPSPANGAWLHTPVVVIDDQPDQLVTYIAPGARFEFPDGDWPTPDGRHPWHRRTHWTGHGCLMVHHPGEHHAVWHFWDGPDRDFACWYLNLQTELVRTPIGYDTQDLELDIIVWPDGTNEVKDADVLDDRVAEGRYSPALVSWIRGHGEHLVDRLAREGIWWDRRWAQWSPPDLPPPTPSTWRRLLGC